MEEIILKYGCDIAEFFNADTLRAIDYGILDLSGINDCELKSLLLYFERVLAAELEKNYLENGTGVFRVSKIKKTWFYNEWGHIIKASTLGELKESVIRENRIWYVFDELAMNNPEAL